MYTVYHVHIHMSEGLWFFNKIKNKKSFGGTVFQGDDLGSGKCIFIGGGGGTTSHWGELTYGEIR